MALLRALALALPLILAAAGAAAKDEACTDGVDCLCDDIAALEADSGATVVFCEDFEAASLNDGDTSEGSDANGTIWGDGWATKYGAGSDACIDLSKPPGIGRRDDGMEGTHSWSCINVVQEGACEVGTDCVMQGASSLTHRYIPGNTNGISSNGISGSAWTVTRDFGITMAVKWSSNYSSPNENSVSGAKTNEFGDGLNCILGCSALNAGASTDDAPFANTVKRLSSNPGGSVATGACAYESEGYRCTASPGSYSMTKGEWMCLRVTYTNWGLAGGTFTYELDGEELIDVTGLNFSSHLDGDTDGIGSMRFNAYYNGVGPGDTGYAGGTQAYRGEDNIVVTNGAPVSCAAIGFGEAPPTPTLTITGLTPSDLTPAFNTAIDLEVAYSASDTTGTITCSADCENDGGYEDGSDTGASPQTITSICAYTSSGAQTIGVRCQDTGPTASDTDTVGVTVDEEPPPVTPPAEPTLVPTTDPRQNGGSYASPRAF